MANDSEEIEYTLEQVAEHDRRQKAAEAEDKKAARQTESEIAPSKRRKARSEE